MAEMHRGIDATNACGETLLAWNMPIEVPHLK
jgi:hypothetical protein